jgi:hypothetical protein
LLGGAVALSFAACAKGNMLTGVGGSGGGGDTSTTTGSGKHDAGNGEIGSTCDDQNPCKMGTCTQVGGQKYCTTPCPPSCPDGTYCSFINGASVCVPDLDQQCLKCLGMVDCKMPSDACLTAPLGDKFCARDCSVDGVCPNGFTCENAVTYETPDAGAPKDGGADGGSKDGGAKDGGSADAGGGTGGGSGSTTPTRWCVPNSGFSCPCNDKRDGVTHECDNKNASGVCKGTETCDGKDAAWKGCTALTPVAETCNNKDDNCDGQIDEGDPNALCSAMGPKPPHANWSCKTGMCSLGACDMGWVQFPLGTPAMGCNCQVDSNEPNGTCAAATNAGSVSDTGGTITLSGTLSSAADVDVFTFQANDVDEGTTNSFHVSLAFTMPTTNNEFVMDVIKGSNCTDTPTGPGVGITSYDWCVNGSDGATPPKGEGTCGLQSVNHCGGTPGEMGSTTTLSHSSQFYVRVYRKSGATASCTPYQITVGGGGGQCDFTQACQ